MSDKTRPTDQTEDVEPTLDGDTPIVADRLGEVRDAFRAIARQIAILRQLDLEERHPAVIFRPLRRGGST